jgi:hypothetical protein
LVYFRINGVSDFLYTFYHRIGKVTYGKVTVSQNSLLNQYFFSKE